MTERKKAVKNHVEPSKKPRETGVKDVREKQFVPRNSLLTDLYKTSHILCIYRIFAVAVFMFYLRTVLAEIAEGETFTFGLKHIIKSVMEIHNVAKIWAYMAILTTLVYPAFFLWAKIRSKLHANKLLPIWDLFGFTWIIGYYVCLMYFPVSWRGVPPFLANNLVLLVEQVRLAMKTHGFIRSNVPRILAYKPKNDLGLNVPKFSSFLYYYFAPTFVYRDQYPRTKQVNWKHFFALLAEFFVLLFWFSFLMDNVIERYQDFGLKKETWWSLLLHVLETMLVAPFLFVAGNYTILHTWSNLWAEALTFADRQFYEDWWNSTDYSRYYRVWNLVVYGYLHEYIYKDFIKHITPGNKVISACATVLISAIVHEYILAFTMGFFLPVLFVHFGICSLPLSFIRLKYQTFTNCFFVWSIIFGTGIEVAVYSMEYFARINCPAEVSWQEYLVPRMLTCNGLDL